MQARGFSVVLVLVSSSGPGSKPFHHRAHRETPWSFLGDLCDLCGKNNAFKGFGYRFS